MPSAQDTYDAINQILQAAAECLTRCRTKPSPSKERLDRILRAESTLKALRIKAEAALAAILAPARRQLFEQDEKIKTLQARMSKIQQERQSLASAEARAERDYAVNRQKAAESGGPEAVKQLDEERSKRRTGHAHDSQRLQDELNALGVNLQELQGQLPMLQADFERNKKELLSRSDPTLEGIEQESSMQLNDVGGLERDIEKEIRIGEELRQIAKADFESKSKDFETAEEFHRSQAFRMLWAILSMVVISVVVIYLLFIRAQLPSDVPPGGPVVVTIERMVFFSVGRIALLFFCAWAIKYLSELHRSHSEQSVIYRDRKAALGVAQSMLNASPELTQKQELLRTLATGYLNFDQNAFHASREVDPIVRTNFRVPLFGSQPTVRVC